MANQFKIYQRNDMKWCITWKVLIRLEKIMSLNLLINSEWKYPSPCCWMNETHQETSYNSLMICSKTFCKEFCRSFHLEIRDRISQIGMERLQNWTQCIESCFFCLICSYSPLSWFTDVSIPKFHGFKYNGIHAHYTHITQTGRESQKYSFFVGSVIFGFCRNSFVSFL